VIVDRVEHPSWLSNAYLIADAPGGHGVLVDSNGLTSALEERAVREGITITHVLCTHDHADHVVDIAEVAGRVGAPLLAHPLAGVAADERLFDGETITSGTLVLRALYTPGHCADHIAFVADDTHCLTADVLFKGTVGGTAGTGGSLAALKHSILEVLLSLPPATVVLPGHREATTIGAEREANPFIRAWPRLGPRGDAPALGGRLRRRPQGPRPLPDRRGDDRRRVAGRALAPEVRAQATVGSVAKDDGGACCGRRNMTTLTIAAQRPTAMSANHPMGGITAAIPITMATHPSHLGSTSERAIAMPFPIANPAMPTRSEMKKRSLLSTLNACSAAGLILPGASMTLEVIAAAIARPTARTMPPAKPRAIGPSEFERGRRWEPSAAANKRTNSAP
jgi:hydroxyacylglutathione hydrolase